MKLRYKLLLKAPLALTLMSTWAYVNGADMVNEHEQITVSESRKFEEKSGEALYHSVCRGCHMSEGQGAFGAAQYPALANNPKLAGAPYPIYMVLKGQGAMPGFADYMSDEQVAEVVNYIRTHFGNDYKDITKVETVKNIR